VKVKTPTQSARCGDDRRNDENTHDYPLKRYITPAKPAETKGECTTFRRAFGDEIATVTNGSEAQRAESVRTLTEPSCGSKMQI
jgi:hypothetical protein